MEADRVDTKAASGRKAEVRAFGVMRAIRTAVGGVLMGIANLIPGVSGGTMILAVGLYEEFIDSVADVTALRFRLRRILFLGILFCCAGISIFTLSKVILHLLLWYSSAMFALFVGFTLGGTPLLLKLIGKFRVGSVVGTVAGFGLMAAIAYLKHLGDMAMPRNMPMDFVAGVVGSVTMVLPGISGSYMLLIMDQYDRVIGAVADLKDGALEAIRILIPVGIGAVIGIVGLSNLLKYLLRRHAHVTLGFLLGMLLGSVLGLWPFGRPPTEKLLHEQTPAKLRAFADREGITETQGLEGDALAQRVLAGWDERQSNPYETRRVVTASAMFVAGLIVTTLLGRLGGGKEPDDGDSPA